MGHPREALAKEELLRARVEGYGEDVRETALGRLVDQARDQPVADALALEAGDRIQADDLPGALARVRHRQQPGHADEMAVADGGAEATGENLADLLGRAHLEQPLALPALEEAVGLTEVVEAERTHPAVVAGREEGARALVGEELLADAVERAEVHGLDPARERGAHRRQEIASLPEPRPFGLAIAQDRVEHVGIDEGELRPAGDETALVVDQHELRQAQRLGHARRLL